MLTAVFSHSQSHLSSADEIAEMIRFHGQLLLIGFAYYSTDIRSWLDPKMDRKPTPQSVRKQSPNNIINKYIYNKTTDNLESYAVAKDQKTPTGGAEIRLQGMLW